MIESKSLAHFKTTTNSKSRLWKHFLSIGADVDQRCAEDVAAVNICCRHLLWQLKTFVPPISAMSYSCLIWADATHHESQKPRKGRQMLCWWKLWWWWLNRQARWLWRMVTCDSRNSLISQLLPPILLCNTILLQYYSGQQLLLLLWYTDNFSVTFYMNAL